jgi:hypothetical protein
VWCPGRSLGDPAAVGPRLSRLPPGAPGRHAPRRPVDRARTRLVCGPEEWSDRDGRGRRTAEGDADRGATRQHARGLVVAGGRLPGRAARRRSQRPAVGPGTRAARVHHGEPVRSPVRERGRQLQRSGRGLPPPGRIPARLPERAGLHDLRSVHSRHGGPTGRSGGCTRDTSSWRVDSSDRRGSPPSKGSRASGGWWYTRTSSRAAPTSPAGGHSWWVPVPAVTRSHTTCMNMAPTSPCCSAARRTS